MSQFFGSLSKGFGRTNKNKQGKAPPVPDLPQNYQPQHSPSSSHGGGVIQQGPPSSPSSATSGTPRARPLFLCQPFVKASLLRGSMKTIVVLPKYVDKGEWLALNVFEFFEYLKMFHGVIQEFCTVKSCPSMSAGPKFDYKWLDSHKRPTTLPAPNYIAYVFNWIQDKTNDESIFPTKTKPTTTAMLNTPSAGALASSPGSGNAAAAGNGDWIGKEGGFPPEFYEKCRGIYKQMFRVFAHIYHTHFDKIVHLSLEAHWNSFFAHFVHFGREFDLLDKKDTESLKELIEAFDAQTASLAASSSSASGAASSGGGR